MYDWLVEYDEGNASGTGLKWATAGSITSFQIRSQTMPIISIASPRGKYLLLWHVWCMPS
jgi:hypothetical protein